MRVALIALLCLGRGAFADATPPPTDGKQPDGFLVLSDPRGVIVPAEHAGEFFYAKTNEQTFWTPSVADVRRFEDRAATLIGPELKLSAAELRTRHIRQYVGIADKKSRRIWINFFCQSHVKDWTRQVVLVKDGGSCYLQLEFDTRFGTVGKLSVNGSG